MRLFLILCWLMLPLLAWAYHVGPGQEYLASDDASSFLRSAQAAAAADKHAEATSLYGKAISELPEDKLNQKYAITLEMAKYS